MKELLSSGESIIANKIQTIQIQSSAYPFRESAYMDYPVTPHHDKKIFSALLLKFFKNLNLPIIREGELTLCKILKTKDKLVV